MSVKIRDMIESDIAPLAKIVGENYDRHCAEMFWTEAGCAFYRYPFRPRFIVADDGVPVGCACWTNDWCSWGVFNLCWVQVAKPLQRQGIGRALIDHALAELRPQASMVLLSTSLPEYYLHWGFKPFAAYEVAANYDGSERETLMGLTLHVSGFEQGANVGS